MILENKLGITDQIELSKEEERLSKIAAKELFDNGIIDDKSEKRPPIYLILLISHSDISGNDFNDLHPENKPYIYLTLLISHFDISGNDSNKSHL